MYIKRERKINGDTIKLFTTSTNNEFFVTGIFKVFLSSSSN